MTTYRLPDWLGGHKCQALNENSSQGVLVEIDQYEGQRIIVPRDLLAEVKPPLPPQPEYGEFVACGTDGNLLPIYRRWMDPDGWSDVSDRNSHSVPWAQVCEVSQNRAYRNPIRLIADPADDAPPLPWTLDSCRRSASVGTPRHGTVVVDVPGIDYTPGECEQIARALLSAARAAREVEQP